jgi:hypothetical protein
VTAEIEEPPSQALPWVMVVRRAAIRSVLLGLPLVGLSLVALHSYLKSAREFGVAATGAELLGVGVFPGTVAELRASGRVKARHLDLAVAALVLALDALGTAAALLNASYAWASLAGQGMTRALGSVESLAAKLADPLTPFWLVLTALPFALLAYARLRKVPLGAQIVLVGAVWVLADAASFAFLMNDDSTAGSRATGGCFTGTMGGLFVPAFAWAADRIDEKLFAAAPE